MVDIGSIIFSVEITLLDLSKQAFALASALQNAAPGDEAKDPNKSVVYLFNISEKLENSWQKCKALSGGAPVDQADKLFECLQEAVAADATLREQYVIKDKFRFIRDKLAALYAQIEKEIIEFKKENVKVVETLKDDERVVFVYLFNAQGLTLDMWRKMVNPSVFYEYSVNRPIYGEKAHVESFINRKANKLQHAYLSFAIKKEQVLQEGGTLKDAYDNPVLKVREGALNPNKIVGFTHNNLEYEVSAEGVLSRKL